MPKNENRILKIALVVALPCVLIAAILSWIAFHQESSSTTPSHSSATRLDFNETKRKAEAGDAQAQCDVGEMLAEGKQGQPNFQEAAQWYRKAADQNHARAQYRLGELYDIGRGVKQDEATAGEWYRKAAEAGLADAQYIYASMLSLGRGVTANTEEALKWYHRAAEQGDGLSMYQLAERYERERGVKQDFVEAYKWHSLAAERGVSDAVAARKNIESKLTSEQRAEARKRAADFRAKFQEKWKGQ